MIPCKPSKLKIKTRELSHYCWPELGRFWINAVDSTSLFVGHIFYLLDKWAIEQYPFCSWRLYFPMTNDYSDGLSARQSWDCLSTLWPLAMSLYIILISNNQGLGWWWMGWRAKMASARTLGAPPAPFPDWLRAPSRDWALGQSAAVYGPSPEEGTGEGEVWGGDTLEGHGSWLSNSQRPDTA